MSFANAALAGVSVGNAAFGPLAQSLDPLRRLQRQLLMQELQTNPQRLRLLQQEIGLRSAQAESERARVGIAQAQEDRLSSLLPGQIEAQSLQNQLAGLEASLFDARRQGLEIGNEAQRAQIERLQARNPLEMAGLKLQNLAMLSDVERQGALLPLQVEGLGLQNRALSGSISREAQAFPEELRSASLRNELLESEVGLGDLRKSSLETAIEAQRAATAATASSAERLEKLFPGQLEAQRVQNAQARSDLKLQPLRARSIESAIKAQETQTKLTETAVREAEAVLPMIESFVKSIEKGFKGASQREIQAITEAKAALERIAREENLGPLYEGVPYEPQGPSRPTPFAPAPAPRGPRGPFINKDAVRYGRNVDTFFKNVALSPLAGLMKIQEFLNEVGDPVGAARRERIERERGR